MAMQLDVFSSRIQAVFELVVVGIIHVTSAPLLQLEPLSMSREAGYPCPACPKFWGAPHGRWTAL